MTSVVFFGAHADDVEIGAGGTCAKLTAAGFVVHIVIATDEMDRAMAMRRRSEAIAAARALGVPACNVHFLGHPDGDLRCTRSSVGQLRSTMTALGLKPRLVFTHTDSDSHNDHVELTKIVRGAVRGTTILKYIVRNSAVVSHFTPKLYSQVDKTLGAKARALVQHSSQVAAGRISLDRLMAFASQFGVAESGEHLEAFDLELQDGAVEVGDIIDIVNDAPFSRFWSPLHKLGDLTILAGNGKRTLTTALSPALAGSTAPATLELIVRMQSLLLATFVTDPQRNPRKLVRVAPVHAAGLDDVETGSALILGTTAANAAAATAFARLPKPRFRMDFGSTEHAGCPIIDAATGRIVQPTFRKTAVGSRPQPAAGGAATVTAGRPEGGDMELIRDWGVLTIARCERSSGSPLVVINAAGIGPAGFAAAMQCLLEPSPLATIVTDALAVTSGRETMVQWLVPSTPSGEPVVEEIVPSIAEARTRPAGGAVARLTTPVKSKPKAMARSRRAVAR